MSEDVFKPPKSASEKKGQITADVIRITPEMVAKWEIPMGQRPLTINPKVRRATIKIKEDGGIVPGTITLAILNGVVYICDGQHRMSAFLAACLKEGLISVRVMHVTTLKEILDEFIMLNGYLKAIKPDDILRAMEVGGNPMLGEIRKQCPFVGFDNVRRGTCAPLVSMSLILRVWRGSALETPSGSAGMNAQELGEHITVEEARVLISFLTLAHEAFGRDPTTFQLWAALNLTLCMWLYRNMVLGKYSEKTTPLTPALFKKCLLALSANASYTEWLVGRNLSQLNRPRCYDKIQKIFHSRLVVELATRKVEVPEPAWARV